MALWPMVLNPTSKMRERGATPYSWEGTDAGIQQSPGNTLPFSVKISALHYTRTTPDGISMVFDWDRWNQSHFETVPEVSLSHTPSTTCPTFMPSNQRSPFSLYLQTSMDTSLEGKFNEAWIYGGCPWRFVVIWQSRLTSRCDIRIAPSHDPQTPPIGASLASLTVAIVF